MAVDEELRRRDMFPVRTGPDDERVALDGWVYYVRAVKWKQDLAGEPLAHGHVEVLVLAQLAWRGVRRALRPRRPWTVGVVRIGDVATWNTLTPRVVHAEQLPPGRPPRARVLELANLAARGDFASAP